MLTLDMFDEVFQQQTDEASAEEGTEQTLAADDSEQEKKELDFDKLSSTVLISFENITGERELIIESISNNSGSLFSRKSSVHIFSLSHATLVRSL